MKLEEGLYYCEWCSNEFEQQINKCSGNGKKGTGSDQCICTKCYRKVSQKTKLEIENKIRRGEKV